MYYEVILSQDKVYTRFWGRDFFLFCGLDIISFLSGEVALLANYVKKVFFRRAIRFKDLGAISSCTHLFYFGGGGVGRVEVLKFYLLIIGNLLNLLIQSLESLGETYCITLKCIDSSIS